MKCEYYMHRSEGVVGDYFGYIGTPFRVHMLQYYFFTAMRYRTTRVPKGSTVCEVIEQAIDNHYMHPTSFSAEKLRDKYCREIWYEESLRN